MHFIRSRNWVWVLYIYRKFRLRLRYSMLYLHVRPEWQQRLDIQNKYLIEIYMKILAVSFASPNTNENESNNRKIGWTTKSRRLIGKITQKLVDTRCVRSYNSLESKTNISKWTFMLLRPIAETPADIRRRNRYAVLSLLRDWSERNPK